MKYLRQIEYSILAAMTFSLVRTFVHSLISEQNRYSRLYNFVFKERLEWKDAGVLLLLSLLLIPWVFDTYCIK